MTQVFNLYFSITINIVLEECFKSHDMNFHFRDQVPITRRRGEKERVKLMGGKIIFLRKTFQLNIAMIPS